MTVDARLKREIAGGSIAPWELVADTENPDSGLSDPVIDFGARALLQALLTELGQKYEGSPIALDPATLAVLEQITATLTNTDFPDAAVLAKLETIRALVAGTLTVEAASLPLPTGAATQTTLALMLAKLNDIFAAVDGLEITADNIDISNTNIGLAVDDVESLLQQIRDNAIAEDFASETTLAAALAKLEAVRALLAGTLAVGGTVTANHGTIDGVATETTLDAINGKLADLSGTWSYKAGTSGTVVLSGSKRVIGIAAHATSAGSFTINGGDAIAVPANSSIEIQPIGNLTDPTIVFTDTDSYFVETVV